MSKQMKLAGLIPQRLASILAASLLCGVFQPLAAPLAQAAPKTATRPLAAGAPLAPCSSTSIAPPTTITLGKSALVRLSSPAVRLVVGGTGSGHAGKPFDGGMKDAPPPAPMAPTAANLKTGVAEVDVMLLSPNELYLLGKRVGSMNLIVQDQADKCTVMDIAVTMDSSSLQAKFAQLMPDEKNIKVAAAEDSLILSGEVGDAVKVERAMTLAAAYAPEKRLVNMLRATAANQVMLEVKVAEVSKTLLDKLGSSVAATSGGSGWQYSLASSFLTDGTGFLQALKTGKGNWQINGEKDDGVVRVLAEPNLMAISGQQASFLSGGKIFIPVAQSNNGGLGGTTITLEEKEFGVGLKFLPTVLEGDRINLKVASEVSELSQTGSPFTTVGGITAVLPSMTTRRADTTVQLRDGQSFAIAGLIKNNLTESVKRFPGLGDVPVLGALFRSSEFQRDMTELLFIITPRLVKPLPANYALPTDHFSEPTRGEFLIGGKLEGSAGPATGKPRKAGAPLSDAGDATPAKALPPAADAQPATPQPADAKANDAKASDAKANDAKASDPKPAGGGQPPLGAAPEKAAAVARPNAPVAAVASAGGTAPAKPQPADPAAADADGTSMKALPAKPAVAAPPAPLKVSRSMEAQTVAKLEAREAAAAAQPTAVAVAVPAAAPAAMPAATEAADKVTEEMMNDYGAMP
ncbi:MAG: pilus assembly protein N-terminal domain-containing protein [Rhodocyclaceae bacterium]|nr:pilus assembly protein N-terminal domain-containing protein [Rhodocyclaceae bacterium]